MIGPYRRICRHYFLGTVQLGQEIGRRKGFNQLHACCRQHGSKVLDHREDFLLGLIVERREVFGHVSCEVQIVLENMYQ